MAQLRVQIPETTLAALDTLASARDLDRRGMVILAIGEITRHGMPVPAGVTNPKVKVDKPPPGPKPKHLDVDKRLSQRKMGALVIDDVVLTYDPNHSTEGWWQCTLTWEPWGKLSWTDKFTIPFQQICSGHTRATAAQLARIDKYEFERLDRTYAGHAHLLDPRPEPAPWPRALGQWSRNHPRWLDGTYVEAVV